MFSKLALLGALVAGLAQASPAPLSVAELSSPVIEGRTFGHTKPAVFNIAKSWKNHILYSG